MQLFEAWKLVILERYAKFDGRAGRGEFWWFALANFLVYLLLVILMQVSGFFFVLYLVYVLALIVPTLAVAVRRLHDTNKSGWFLLMGLIPLVGAIILLVFYIQEGTPGPNDFGVAAEPGV